MRYLLVIFCLMQSVHAQFAGTEMQGLEDDFIVGGDIFSDFNQDIEAAKVQEDERFYRYGRFYSVNMGVGLTSFTGNRGRAYDNDPPGYHLSLTYFFNFKTAFVFGIAYSKHRMVIDTKTEGFPGTNPGLITVNMLRTFWGFRYYFETADLGTAITYSNPYLTARMEYWYQTNKFVEEEQYGKNSGGGLGTAVGAGLEFPLELKKSYMGVEILYHTVNFFDKYTTKYRQDATDSNSTYGYEDLSGNVWTTAVTYNMSW